MFLPESEITDACSMRMAIFADELIVSVEIDGGDLIPASEDAFMEGIYPASPNSILMFVLSPFAGDICIRIFYTELDVKCNAYHC